MDGWPLITDTLIDYTPSVEGEARAFLLEFNEASLIFLAAMKDSGVVLV